MLACAELFAEDLKSKNLNFTINEAADGDVVVKFPYDGKFTTFVFSGDEGRYVSMYTLFDSVPADRVSDVIICCNSLNAMYKWLKFYVDKDNDLMIQDDAIISQDTAAEECFELLLRRINILKDEKVRIMRAIYGL